MSAKSELKKLFIAMRGPVLAVVFALLFAAIFLCVVGESPSVLLEALYNTLFRSFGLGYSLFYATPLIFTGLACAIPFHCGLFNIGAEGQLYLGAVAVIVVASLFPGAPCWVGIPLGFVAAFVAGGIWGGIPGYLKAKRGSHEVIVTILLNFVAVAIGDYLILYRYHDPQLQAPESLSIGKGYEIPKLEHIFPGLFHSTPVNAALFLAIAACVACYFFLFFSTRGFELRSVGRNQTASRFAGISVPGSMALSLFLGGALAGLVGVNEVMGYHHSMIEGFSPGYGFTGIAVALLARNHPLAILLTAFLFGGLTNCARELEFLSDKVSKELSIVLQGLLIAIVACDVYFREVYGRFKRKRSTPPEGKLPPPPAKQAVALRAELQNDEIPTILEEGRVDA